ncbi:hypothetical protein B4U79_06288 [Dinothrombium tinctorium]|uniref:Phosphatidylcholine transfer protein n=1 Tax=Dinothrombium tinctorium TaxID=1965070 RepID=A0A3S3QNC3_9ACAR|nr:hypothetical protein B4U79_10469 [Dinothrombium tinctorium]RWS11473.1 hypothetical protein B4U79_06288 [Dinothrombium tinctorium]
MISDSLIRVLSIQCNFHAIQRIRRASQIYTLYTRLYGERTVNTMLSRFWHRMRTRILHLLRSQSVASKSYRFLLANAAFFSWEASGISSEEINKAIDDFRNVFSDSDQKLDIHSNQFNKSTNSLNECKRFKCRENLLKDDGWELIIIRSNFQVWRKPTTTSGLYQYKVFGSFFDIPARVFFIAQYDTEYRKQWDKLVIKLDVIDKEKKETPQFDDYMDSGNEIVHWVMHYPFPMYSREYCFVRRAVIDKKNNVMILISRAVSHPSCIQSNGYVRVEQYESQMVIKPHRSFDENGFDYTLTYFDDPKSAFPSPAYNWMACSGVPEFVDKVHNAAVAINGNSKNKFVKTETRSSHGNQGISNREWGYA